MNKILIIIQREFLNRVSKKSFILLTILMPFIFAALIFVPALLSTDKSTSDNSRMMNLIISSPDKKCCPNTEVILPA